MDVMTEFLESYLLKKEPTPSELEGQTLPGVEALENANNLIVTQSSSNRILLAEEDRDRVRLKQDLMAPELLSDASKGVVQNPKLKEALGMEAEQLFGLAEHCVLVSGAVKSWERSYDAADASLLLSTTETDEALDEIDLALRGAIQVLPRTARHGLLNLFGDAIRLRALINKERESALSDRAEWALGVVDSQRDDPGKNGTVERFLLAIQNGYFPE